MKSGLIHRARAFFVVAVVIHCAAAALGRETGPRLLSGGGLTIPPDVVSASVEPEKLPTTLPADVGKPLSAILRGTLRGADGLIAGDQVAAADAVAVTRPVAPVDAAVRRQKLTKLARQLIGRPVSGEFVVLDVIESPAAAATTQPAAAAAGRFVAVCSIAVPGPDRFTREESAEAKKIQDDWRAQAKQMTDRAVDRRQARQIQVESEKRLRQILADYRQRAAKRRPTHYVYFVGDDAALATWRAGGTRTVQGVIQSVAMSVTTVEPRDGPQPAVDVVVRLFPE